MANLIVQVGSFLYAECLSSSNVTQRTNLSCDKIITNSSIGDGFGAQFQTIIYTVIYAELNGIKFLYTPFKKMEHNYDNDINFLKKKEDLINFIGNFEINEDLILQSKMSRPDFFEKNLTVCAESASLKKIKDLFRSNKNRDDYFADNNLNIAIHVRRPNAHDSRIAGTDTTDEIYLRIIDTLRGIYRLKSPLFHIYSQGNLESLEKVYCANDVILHVNGPVEEAFTSMVLADVLVTGTSSLSYTAGILSEGTVYYMPFWHPPLPSWVILQYQN